MKQKKVLIYIVLFLSVGSVIYNYIFNDYGYGMMNHHYGYYDDYSLDMYYLNMGLLGVSYIAILICVFMLIGMRVNFDSKATTILNERLSRGEITLEEYRKIKETIRMK